MSVHPISQESTTRPGAASRAVRDWLPSRGQMRTALQLDPRYPIIDGFGAPLPPDSLVATSMRQAMGLVVVAALAAGLIPFLFTWVLAAQAGTAAQLAQVAASVSADAGPSGEIGLVPLIIDDALSSLAAMEPALFPGWLAATLTALGEWIEWPLHWLTVWIVYGLAVLVVLKLLGATTTLQRFYAITAYTALPLVLVGLGPIPCLGVVASLVGIVWGFMLLLRVLRAETRLGAGQVVIAALTPAVLMLLAVLIFAGAFAVSLAGLLF